VVAIPKVPTLLSINANAPRPALQFAIPGAAAPRAAYVISLKPAENRQPVGLARHLLYMGCRLKAGNWRVELGIFFKASFFHSPPC